MIKIELSDIESLSPEALRATGNYLLALAGTESCEAVEPDASVAVEETKPAPVIPPPAPQPVTPPPPPPAPQPVTPPPTPICEARAERPASEVFKKPQPVTAVPDRTEPINAAEERPEPINAEHPSVELDSDGFPWDSRIHSRTKSKTKDGRWKKIRGVGAEIVKRVEDELKKVQNIPAAPAPAPSVSSESPPTFADLMSLVTRSITNGKLTREQVIEVLKPFEIPSLPLLATRLDLIPAVVQAFKGVIDAA